MEFKESYMLNKKDTEIFYPTLEFTQILELVWDIVDTDKYLKHCSEYNSDNCETMFIRQFKSCIREQLEYLRDDLTKWIENGSKIESRDTPDD